MVITNSGFATAKDVHIASSQPEIIENEKGLYIDFQLVSMSINHQLSYNPTLLVNLGNILPSMTTNIRWSMMATVMG